MRRYEVALVVDADDLLAVLTGQATAVIPPFGDPSSLRNAMVRTLEYEGRRHMVTLIIETSGLTPVPKGAPPPEYFVERSEETP
jgi:hypothetical protein